MKVTVGISNRHVHLTKGTYEVLFGKKDLKCKRALNQIGEFASDETVDVEYGEKTIKNVRIVGPFRDCNQVELLGSDAELLGIELPVRRSGDLDNTPSVKLATDIGNCSVDGVIRAEKHVHVPTSREDELGLHERDIVKITTSSGDEFYSNVKVSQNGFFELHIDKDEASEYNLANGDIVELELCGR